LVGDCGRAPDDAALFNQFQYLNKIFRQNFETNYNRGRGDSSIHETSQFSFFNFWCSVIGQLFGQRFQQLYDIGLCLGSGQFDIRRTQNPRFDNTFGHTHGTKNSSL